MERLRFWVCLASTSLITAAVLSVCPVRGEGDLYRDVLRLRVVAASDDREDQADKLAVRDAVLELMEERIRSAKNREEAEREAENMTDEIRRRAEDCLKARGTFEQVCVTLGWEASPRRDYGEAVLPAGTYRTLKITIGGGVGQNWWCVLFPGICMRYAESGEESVAVGLTPEEYRLITNAGKGRVRVKFWILEKLGELTGGSEKRRADRDDSAGRTQ